jgi:hypothetical protein
LTRTRSWPWSTAKTRGNSARTTITWNNDMSGKNGRGSLNLNRTHSWPWALGHGQNVWKQRPNSDNVENGQKR